jgi:hypothetical protein
MTEFKDREFKDPQTAEFRPTADMSAIAAVGSRHARRNPALEYN